MPYAAPSHCEGAGCNQLASPGRRVCPAHTKPTDNISSTQRGYDVAWMRVRLSVLRRQPWCAACHAEGLVTIATEVDHIIPLSKGGARLDLANLQPLCRPCHIAKTQQDKSSGTR